MISENQAQRLGVETKESGPPVAAFVTRTLLWIVAFFGLLRLPWVQHQILIPFASLQQSLGCLITGAPKGGLNVDLSCTGSDAMALCLGAIFAFPVPWRRRLAGAAAGLALVVAVNTVRIGTLSLVATRPGLMKLLHIYVWPIVLVLVAAGYVFWWMSRTGGTGVFARGSSAPDRSRVQAAHAPRTWRFMALTTALVLLYYAAQRWLLHSQALLLVAQAASGVAAQVMSFVGIGVERSGNLPRTEYGSWVVNQECVVTPLVAVYLAAVWSAGVTVAKRWLWTVAAVPLFTLLATARLLVLALPAALVGSHSVAIHAFYQLLTAIVLVALVVRWSRARSSDQNAPTDRSALVAVLAGIAVALIYGFIAQAWLWPLLGRLAENWHLGHRVLDPQGALALLPAFQIGFFTALLVAMRQRLDRAVALTFAALFLLQGLFLVAWGETAVHLFIEPPVVAIRAVSLAVPLLLVWFLQRYTGEGKPARP